MFSWIEIIESIIYRHFVPSLAWEQWVSPYVSGKWNISALEISALFITQMNGSWKLILELLTICMMIYLSLKKYGFKLNFYEISRSASCPERVGQSEPQLGNVVRLVGKRRSWVRGRSESTLLFGSAQWTLLNPSIQRFNSELSSLYWMIQISSSIPERGANITYILIYRILVYRPPIFE